MKFTLSLFAACAVLAVVPPEARATGTGPSFKGPIGIQFESLKSHLKSDLPAALAEFQTFGVNYVELVGTYDLTPEALKAMLDTHGLVAISSHYPYKRFQDDVEGIAREAKVLGLKYVGCPAVPAHENLDETSCREAIKMFNEAGAILAGKGLVFFYHPHGFEFKPWGNGTLFDLLMKETDPRYVHFQMDVYWIAFPGQSPAGLLEKYKGRWVSMHLKDMKKGTQTGILTGKSPGDNNVVFGTGQLDMTGILRAAQRVGVRFYFIEDESPSALQQIPQSLRYLETVRW